MADETGIEWCDSTFNPWIGCTKVSPGCDHCYAERSTPARTMGIVWGLNGGPRLTADANWGKPRQWNKAHEAFFAEHGRRRRVFCASLADIFDNRAPDEYRTRLWRLIAETPNLDWLLLTKRIGNALDMLPAFWCAGPRELHGWDKEFKHVSIGISVVNQAEFDRDYGKLLAVPAARRFLSMEPLLGPVKIPRELIARIKGTSQDGQRFIDWVIVGGESGPGARPVHPDWVRSLRDQCAEADVPFFFKQWGQWQPQHRPADADEVVKCVNTWPKGRWLDVDGAAAHRSWATVMVDKVGKKRAGAMLDGREHKAWPA